MTQLREIVPLLDRSLTPEEVSQRLVLPTHTVTRQAREGRIPGGFKVGRYWRFRAGPFTAWSRGWWHPDVCSFDAWYHALQLQRVDP